MSPAVLYCLVILSAIAHPIWNAMMKSSGDRLLTMVGIRSTGLMLGLGWGLASGVGNGDATNEDPCRAPCKGVVRVGNGSHIPLGIYHDDAIGVAAS